MKKYIFILAIALALSGCTVSKNKQISIPENNQNMENTNQVENAPSYSLDELAKHASPTDCWVAANGKVYDVSSFVDKHPGGDKILNGCGKDMTEFFNTKHAKQSKESLPAFYIGDLK